MCGCVATPVQQLTQQWPAELPTHAQLNNTPFIAQDDYECGPAALAMLLQAAGVSVQPEQLRPQVFIPGRQGSLQIEMMVAARRHGLPAYRLQPTLETLMREVAAGHPVLVFQNLSLPIYPVWHYAVVIGYDRDDSTLTLHSGSTPGLTMSLSAFERTWARGDHWAFVALPTSTLPSTADADTLGTAIVALERLNPAAALPAYRTALQRWPDALVLQMGLGNSAYAAGDPTLAATAYRAATQSHPQAADAWNNLAQVLMEQGALGAARHAIEQAIAIGGPRLALYQQLARSLDAEGTP
nr:PA2778 family cysteine peptidase [Roseateles koreensis]